MSKILFYTANGVGLGHIRRSSLIAKSILEVDKNSEVFFVSMCKDASFLDELNIPYSKLTPVSDKIIKNYDENKRCKKINEKKIVEIINDFKPNKIVLDIHVFANFSFPDSVSLEEYRSIEKILIYRMTNKESFVSNFDKFNDKFSTFNKIIIPHSREEIRRVLSHADYQKLSKNDIVSFSGPIFRKLDRSVLPGLKKSYNLNTESFNITVALGGGGELIEGKCETPAGIILKFLNNYDNLNKLCPNVNIIVVTGPLFKHKKIVNIITRKYCRNVKLVKYEKNLMELFSLSDFVVSPIGYNAGNEIIEAKTPALLVPLLRGENNGNEQMERAKYLEKFGFVKVYNSEEGDDFDKKFMECITDMDKMKKSFDNFSYKESGNNKSAEKILDK